MNYYKQNKQINKRNVKHLKVSMSCDKYFWESGSVNRTRNLAQTVHTMKDSTFQLISYLVQPLLRIQYIKLCRNIHIKIYFYFLPRY